MGVGVAIGQSCMLLSAGEKGKRFMLEHATAMLHQPRVPPTGQRQAIEIQIKWREVLAQKQNMLNILARTTGHSPEKLDKVRGGAAGSWRGVLLWFCRVAFHLVLLVWQLAVAGMCCGSCARTHGAEHFTGPAGPPFAPPQDMQRPLYMQPADAKAYGVIDGIVTPEKQIIDDVKSADQWDKEAGLVAR